MWGPSFNDSMTFLQTLAAAAAAGSIWWAVRSYKVVQGQLGFDIIQSCMTRFQNIVADLENIPIPAGNHRDLGVSHSKRAVAKRYIDLCSEELFYFQMGYVPELIMEEWIDGMLSYLPLRDEHNVIVYADYKLRDILRPGDLKDYPRITESFLVKRKPDLQESQAWADFINQIKGNVKKKKRKSPHVIAPTLP
jgi:hypothetical protein